MNTMQYAGSFELVFSLKFAIVSRQLAHWLPTRATQMQTWPSFIVFLDSVARIPFQRAQTIYILPTAMNHQGEDKTGGFFYISPVGRKQLPQYKYTGSDNSLMYTYFCSPLADFLVKLMPMWLAPNVITLLGLAISLAGYILVHFYAPTFQQSCPPWVWYVLSACTFTYQTLDNMDGKQARRTNSSSALGLFIDHGVDALNIVFSSQNVMALLQLGNRESCLACLAVWTASSMPFFFATWEEHFTGSLYLGFFNGPTDGVLILCASYLVTGLSNNPNFWNEDFVFGMSRAESMTSFYLLCVIFTVLANMQSVHRKLRSMRRLGSALLLTLPFSLHLMLAFWAFGPKHPAEADLRLYFWFFGLSFLLLVPLSRTLKGGLT